MADVFTSRAVSFIERMPGPFFLYFAATISMSLEFRNARFAGKTWMGPRGMSFAGIRLECRRSSQNPRQAGTKKKYTVILSSDNGPVVNDGYKDRRLKQLSSPADPIQGGKYSIFEGGTRFLLSSTGRAKWHRNK